MAGTATVDAADLTKDDMTWPEVGRLGLRYLRIPAALLLLEMLYWFLTQPSNTLAWIQTVEAFLWHNLSNLLFGAGSTEFSIHQDWWIRVDLVNANFPDGRLALYVGDECAGVHEMLFISTLVLLTDGVTQRVKLRSMAVLCSIVFILNIIRLTLLYPLALSGCDADPRGIYCADGMYSFHRMMFEWGFLVILVAMWTVWFLWVGGPARVRSASEKTGDGWRLNPREIWKPWHFAIIALALVMFTFAAESWYGPETQAAITEMEDCDSLNEISARCGEAIIEYDDAISTAWSFTTLGLLAIAGTVIRIEKREPDYETE